MSLKLNQATQKQIDLIISMSVDLGLDRYYNFNTMTRQQASEIIEELIDEKNDHDFSHDYLGYDDPWND